MSKITISKLQELTGLSDHSMLWLLKENRLPIEYNQKDGIVIDLNSKVVQEIVSSVSERQKEAILANSSILRELCGRIIRDNIDLIFTEAIKGYRQIRS